MKIWGMGRARKNRNTATTNRRLRIEQLEDKRLLAIVWANEFGANDFGATYGANEIFARETVNRAIDDWNSVLTSFNYAEDNDADPNNNLNDEFQLTVFAEILEPGVRGQVDPADSIFNIDSSPTAGTVRLDDNAGGAGWFFDTTPLDDIEFTSVADTFSASFVDINAVAQARRDDFYRTVTHEIGHAIGIAPVPGFAIDAMLTDLVDASNNPIYYLGLSNQNQLSRFESTRANPAFPGVTATFNGPHIYEGSDVYLLEGVPGVQPDPVTVFEAGNPATPIAFEVHPNDLMNSGITVPGGAFNPENETVRQFISDLDAMILANAYGYAVTLPSTLDSAHVMLDDLTGTLLVQGSARNGTTGVGVTDIITIERVTDALGDDIRVTVDPTGPDIFTERVPYAKVTQIVVNGNDIAFTNDPINKNANVEQPLTRVAYVVSTNEDVLEDANSVGGANANNAIIDLSQVVPGTQVSLRAAIRESNALNGDRPIYVGRGTYDLTLTGVETGTPNDAINDLDITSDVTIIGAGAGLTVIDATAVTDRVFYVRAFHD